MTFRGLTDQIAYAYDRLRITRRVSAMVTLYLVYRVSIEAWGFAESSRFEGIEVAAIIAAVTAPLTALMGYTMKVHHRGHEHPVDIERRE